MGARGVKAASGFLFLVTFFLGLAPVQAQNGQITTITITDPAPPAAGTPATPRRTSRDFFVIKFSHDGSSGSYFIGTDGADIEGAAFDGGPAARVDEVAAGFDTDGVKSINVFIFQTRFNATFQTTVPAQIQYDSKPPDFTLQRLILNAGDPAQQFAAGATLFTSSADLTIEGSVQDPDNGSPSQDIDFSADVDGTVTAFKGAPDGAGTFSSAISLGTEDGEKVVNLTAADSFPDDPPSLPNVSSPFRFKITLDTQPASILSVVIIRDPDDPVRRVELPANGQTFVGRNQIQIRATFSEPLRAQPSLSVTQLNGAAIRTTPLANLAIENRIFTWAYTPNPPDDQNGPADISITDILDRAGNETTGDPLQTVSPGFLVDTIPPVKVRFPTPQPGDVVSSPRDGALVGKDAFPQSIQVFVDDYDTRDATQDTKVNASGVLFEDVAAGAPGSIPDSRSLTIRLLAPDGAEVPGTASLAPPSGIFLTLPDFTDPGAGIPGFTDVDQDGIAEPLEGVWRIEVGLFDKVGNTNTETFTFTVDTTPLQGNTFVVQVANPAPNPNPLVRGSASCWGGDTMRVSSVDPTITVSSTDPTFSTTRSRVEFLSKVGGPNSQPILFDATVSRTPAGIQLTQLREPLKAQATDNFPVTDPPPPSPNLPAGTLDPRLGKSDGIYLVRVYPVDTAGNTGVIDGARGNVREFVEYELNLDTVMPFTTRTFPRGNTAINESLRFVDAIVVDPVSPANGNDGCGVDVNQSTLNWSIEAPYQPNNVDLSLINSANASLPFSGSAPLRGTVRFVHLPNNTDPTLASFNPNDDTFRVLLELTDRNGFVRSLPIDGSMDGVYSITSLPRDMAGNQMPAPSLDGGRSDYFGLASSNETTRNITQFFFLYDTVNPEVTISNLDEDAFIGGASFHLRGETVDLSAQNTAAGSSGEQTQGGSGIDRVEVLLEVVDVNGNPIDGVAATPSTTTNDPSIIIPAKPNPVVPLTLATLSDFNDSSNDPTRTVTTPMTAAFASSQRERRVWDLDLELPTKDRLLTPRDNSPGDSYRLTVRAFDRAGNSTEIRRKVILSLDFLRAPQLEAPACGTFRNSGATTFKWTAVQGAARYRLELEDPNGTVLQRSVVQPTSMSNLTVEGAYRWRVASMDAAGNLGAFSPWCQFTFDRTRPRVLSMLQQDPVEPNPNRGILNTGKVVFTLNFSEPLDSARGVGVLLDPQGGVGAAPLVVTTLSIDQQVWVGEVTIPEDANPAEWDGNASLSIRGAVDLSGNVMLDDRTRTVEIDTGPFFTTRFFVSPFNDQEITVAILSSEDLIEPPTITALQGAKVIDFAGTGSSPRAKPVSGRPRSSFLSLRLSSSGRTNVSFDLTGQDLSLNGSKRSLNFEVIPPSRSSQSALLVSGMKVKVPPGATSGSSLYVFPSLGRGGNSQGLKAMADALAAEQGGAPGGELQELGFPEDLRSSGELKENIEVEIPVQPMLLGRSQEDLGPVGLYHLHKGHWTWLAGVDSEGLIRAELPSLDPLLVAADPVPPQVAVTSHENGATLERPDPKVIWSVSDLGSGVDPASIQILVDDVVVPHAYDSEEKQVELDLDRPLTPGTHRIQLALRDQSGNATRTATLFLTAPANFGFQDPPVPVPNPARITTSIRYDLTQPGSTDEVLLEIFDVGGRRITTMRKSSGFLTRGNTFRWDLTNRRGRRVRNGVYLFRVRARGAGRTVTARGKIAVIR
jgi:hypothetical protein